MCQDEKQELERKNRSIFAQWIRTLSEITYKSTWEEVLPLISKDPPVEVTDIQRLTIFQDRVKELEREQQSVAQHKRTLLKRTERQNRFAFKKKIQDFKSQGLVTRQTLWRDIWTIVKDDEVYTNMVGQPGSVPVDFLRDVQCLMELEYLDAIAGRIPLEEVSDLVKPDVTKYFSEQRNRGDSVTEEAYKMLRKAEPRVRSGDSFRDVSRSCTGAISLIDRSEKDLFSFPRFSSLECVIQVRAGRCI